MEPEHNRNDQILDWNAMQEEILKQFEQLKLDESVTTAAGSETDCNEEMEIGGSNAILGETSETKNKQKQLDEIMHK